MPRDPWALTRALEQEGESRGGGGVDASKLQLEDMNRLDACPTGTEKDQVEVRAGTCLTNVWCRAGRYTNSVKEGGAGPYTSYRYAPQHTGSSVIYQQSNADRSVIADKA